MVALVAVVARIDFGDRDVVSEAFVVHIDVVVLYIVSVSMAAHRGASARRRKCDSPVKISFRAFLAPLA